MAELIPLRRGEPIFDVRGLPTRRFSEYIENATKDINTSTDKSQELEQVASSVQQALAIINAQLEDKARNLTVITANTTAEVDEIYICKNTSTITVTLPSSALTGEVINIKRKGGAVIVSGNIDGKTSKTINIKYYSMKLVFDGTEWAEI